MPIIAAYAAPHPPLLIPEVGKGKEKEALKTIESYEKISKEIAIIKPETIIVISPHTVMYADYFHISPSKSASGSFRQYGAPEVSFNVNYDVNFVEMLCAEAVSAGLEAGTLGEKDRNLDHGTMIPLHFIKKQYSDFQAIRISISGLDFFKHYELGKLISEVADKLGRKAVIVASGDLSHKLLDDGPYGYAPEGPEFDSVILDAFKKSEFDKLLGISDSFSERAAECGLRSFIIMSGAFHKRKVESKVYSYEGPFGVGYVVASFKDAGEDESRDFLEKTKKAQLNELIERRSKEDEYVSLARYVVEHYIKNGRVPEMPSKLPEEMLNERAGVFVSIKKNNNLRGCIGTIMPTQKNTALEIINNAVSSAVNDTRFLPVTEQELPFLSYSVDVLKQLEPINAIDMLDVKKYGLVVRNKYKKGLLLPNLDGIDTIEQQLEVAKKKAGITDGEDFILERFEVVRHK